MNRVFISYRREDSQAYAGRLFDLLTTHLGDSVVFMDIDGISPGENFVQIIGDQLSACSVLLPVIGPRWVHIRRGLFRRLFLPNDFVRLEVLAALRRSIPVIPVLVGGAKMPPASALPKCISALAERNAMPVSDNRFREDVAELADLIKTRVDRAPGNALPLDAEGVKQIIETDIVKMRKRRRVQLATLMGLPSLITVIAFAAWLATQSGIAEPHFAQAQPTPVPPLNRMPHPNDAQDYERLAQMGYMSRPQPFSRSRGDGEEPVLKLSDILGSRGPKAVTAIEKSGEIVFHAVGSTGNINRPRYVQALAGRMIQDFRRPPYEQPSFLFLLGDIVLSFGEEKYYYDQFYSPFRNYPAPILAIAGNHDGSLELGSTARPLDAFLLNFCAEKPFHKSPDSMELDRTAQIQPGVYFTFEAPFVRILALYSNISESEGDIGDAPELGTSQIRFLDAAFRRIKNENFHGAVIVLVHHDVFGLGAQTGSSKMLADLDNVSNSTGVWPHVILSANSHNYLRFTRTVGSKSIEYVVAGTGGANLKPPSGNASSPDVVLQHSEGQNHGYLRLTVNSKQLHLDFQPSDGDTSKATDSFTMDLDSYTLVP